MSSENNSSAEFLADYFAESEEHLGSIRRHLLVLEGFVNGNRPYPDVPDVFDGLLRSLHSLKGLSGMAGTREAE